MDDAPEEEIQEMTLEAAPAEPREQRRSRNRRRHFDLSECTRGMDPALAKALGMCLNCRHAVEASAARITGRKLRALRNTPECSGEKCLAFIRGVEDPLLRFHLAAMAWWRFSTTTQVDAAKAMLEMVKACDKPYPDPSTEYMHLALSVLSGLSEAQRTVWFGHENLYQIASFYAGVRFEDSGTHCAECPLFRRGCTSHTSIGADECELWNDPVIAEMAKGFKCDEQRRLDD